MPMIVVTKLTAGKVNGQWRSMIAFFEMAGYAAAVYVPGKCNICFCCCSVLVFLFAAGVIAATNTQIFLWYLRLLS